MVLNINMVLYMGLILVMSGGGVVKMLLMAGMMMNCIMIGISGSMGMRLML